MSPENIEDLIHKYLSGTATPQERELLDSWYQNQQTNSQQWVADSFDEEQVIKQEMFAEINAAISPEKVRSIRPVYKYVAAASVILLVGSITFFLGTSKQTDSKSNPIVVTTNLPGGTNGAVLTLASGEKVQLNNSAANKISLGEATGISSYNDSVLRYEDSKNKANKQIAYNTLTTPYGRQFSLVLSDGTKVYMNAGSTLEYPVVFQGSERLVKLSGEAYFEVVHNSKIPFRIKVKEQIIEDIGTAFNVSAYKDEKSAAVTLVEGSVKVKKKQSEVIIKPGEQAVTVDGNNNITVREADFDSALAWKNGLFHFSDQQLDVVLKQIARWYNLEIEYQGGIPSKTINGEIYRNMDGVQVLAVLKNLGVNYKLEGNKLIIKK
ncbi:FecR family protein [Flavobacterium sp. GSB-24]|uniref:FecR family protein n=1 Tax=Flavobacterium sp. GSB-24 TaxID=2994319 RepID=UPI0024922ACE|nr:FecR family protein [Flavobacterium sp. GSB-24]BDU25147.1 iron dicitrate transporter FecR [Flavobacterium sp. GSB-24]